MAFKIALTPTYKRKITVEIPNDKGTIDKSTFMVEFRRCDMDDIERLQSVTSQRAVMEEVLVGFSDLVDETGVTVPYNDQTRDALLKIPHALQAISLDFWLTIFKAREKN